MLEAVKRPLKHNFPQQALGLPPKGGGSLVFPKRKSMLLRMKRRRRREAEPKRVILANPILNTNPKPTLSLHEL